MFGLGGETLSKRGWIRGRRTTVPRYNANQRIHGRNKGKSKDDCKKTFTTATIGQTRNTEGNGKPYKPCRASNERKKNVMEKTMEIDECAGRCKYNGRNARGNKMGNRNNRGATIRQVRKAENPMQCPIASPPNQRQKPMKMESPGEMRGKYDIGRNASPFGNLYHMTS